MATQPITERQQRCIYALHRRMGTEMPAEIEKLDVRTASMYIERLKEQLDKPAQVGEEGGAKEASVAPTTMPTRCLPFEERAMFGLAAKLVHQSYNAAGKRVLLCKPDVKKDVVETFHLLREIERELAQAGGGA